MVADKFKSIFEYFDIYFDRFISAYLRAGRRWRRKCTPSGARGKGRRRRGRADRWRGSPVGAPPRSSSGSLFLPA
eukprot:136555-Prorocentrum_minimum.AAC.1